MNPQAEIPVPHSAMREFLTLKKAEEMVQWNKKYTPWIFELDKGVEKELLRQYQDQIEGNFKPEELSQKECEQIEKQIFEDKEAEELFQEESKN